MTNRDYLGYDLDLGFVADEEARVFAGPHSGVDLQGLVRTDVSLRTRDLHLVGGLSNLVQSLIVRLATERGELAPLAHPNYGSRHHHLVGELNTEGNRNLIKLYVLECLRQEPRLEAIRGVDVKPGQGRENRDKVDISITAIAKGVPEPLSFVVPFYFEGVGA